MSDITVQRLRETFKCVFLEYQGAVNESSTSVLFHKNQVQFNVGNLFMLCLRVCPASKDTLCRLLTMLKPLKYTLC